MTDLTFTLLDETGFTTITSWFSDPELRQRFEYPTRIWFDYATGEPNVHAWIIEEDGLPVGHLQLDIAADEIGYIGFFVQPELRGLSYGKRILRALLARPEVNTLERVMAEAEADNLASHRCLKAAGFTLEESKSGEDGFIRFVYIPAKTAGW